jgi:regulator of replication initiation timing
LLRSGIHLLVLQRFILEQALANGCVFDVVLWQAENRGLAEQVARLELKLASVNAENLALQTENADLRERLQAAKAVV